MVSRKPVVNHCAVAALMLRSIMSVGKATLMIVSLRMTTKVEMIRMPMTRRFRAAIWSAVDRSSGTGADAVSGIDEDWANRVPFLSFDRNRRQPVRPGGDDERSL